jgi:hypothetical protein
MLKYRFKSHFFLIPYTYEQTSMVDNYFDDLRLKCLLNEKISRSEASGWMRLLGDVSHL